MKQTPPLGSTIGGVLARNFSATFAGQVLVMAFALATTPYIINGLGSKPYGVLMLLSTFIQLLSLHQLGVNAGLIKFVAGHFDTGDIDELNKYLSTALILYLGVGIAVTIASVVVGPWLIVRFFNIPPDLHTTAVVALYFVSAAFLLRFLAEVFFTVPMATQRIHVATGILITSEAIRTLGAVWVVHEGLGLAGVGGVLVVANAIFLVGTIVVAHRLIPGLVIRPRLSRSHASTLLRYSAPIAVFKINGHLGGVVDKFMIAHFLPIGVLGVYEVCYSLAQKIIILSGNVVSVVFPMASTLGNEASRPRLREIYLRSTKVVLSLVGLPAVVLCVFSRELLRHWINAEFAELGALVLCIVTSAFIIRTLGVIPHTICIATWRPALSAQFALCQGAINVVLLAVLVPTFGIAGAAIALLCSELAVTPVLLHVMQRSVHVSWGTFLSNSIVRIGAVMICTLIAGVAMQPLVHSLATLICAVAALTGLYLLLLVWLVVDATDRGACRRVFEQTVAALGRS